MHYYLLEIILLSLASTYCSALAIVNDTSLKVLDSYTRSELKLLPILRDRVKDGLTLHYMFENKYLVRFLRAANWDVDEAEKRLRDNFSWRKLHHVDSLVFSNLSMSKYSRTFPFFFTWDRDQRPSNRKKLNKTIISVMVLILVHYAMVGSFKDLNVRQLIIRNGVSGLRRYVIFVIERAVWNIHLTANRTRIEIIGDNFLFNMAGFNLRNHACVACIPLWIEMVESYERYYPQLATGIIVINIPAVFHRTYQLIKPLATGPTLKAVELYSVDKSEWGPQLLKKFEKEKITLEFGGTAPPQKFYRLTQEHLTVMLGPQAKTEWLANQ